MKPAAALAAGNPALWLGLLVIVVLGLVMRTTFYTGFYGSDEVTYIDAAAKVLRGDWTPSGYIGAIRYGHQLPMAGFMALFGQNEIAANLWPLLCSLGEIALVVLVGNQLIGFRAALLGGLVLAVLPLHVHYAGRIMADAPLAFFMTASFLLFWLGQQKDKAFLFLLAGLAAGYVFWVKEVTVIYLALFLTFPLFFRCWNWKWMWMLAGFVVVLGANFAIFWSTAGDPLYVLKIAARAASDYASGSARFANAAAMATSPFYYFEYLFPKAYHSWLLGYLALAGLYLLLRGSPVRNTLPGRAFVVWWGLGLLLFFSLLPVSLNPLKLLSKQVNYLLMFTAPLALLAGYFLASLRGRTLAIAVALVIIPGIFLSALEKNVITVFTANSKAAVQLAQQHPEARVYGPAGAERAALFYALVNPAAAGRIEPVATLLAQAGQSTHKGVTYAILDTQTATWAGDRLKTKADVPKCWILDKPLEPVLETSLAGVFRLIGATSARLLPGSINDKVAGKLRELTTPDPAYVYKVPALQPGQTCEG